MFGGLNRLLVAAAVAGAALTAVLAGPPAALAGCGGSTSAVNVYSECPVQSGGGSKPTHSGTPSGSGGQSVGSNPDAGSTSSPTYESRATQKALSHAGKDARTLRALVSNYGLRRHLQASHAGTGTTPDAVGSAFDLGSGPTALLIVLAGTAFLLLGGSGMRVWRQRHRP